MKKKVILCVKYLDNYTNCICLLELCFSLNYVREISKREL